VRILHHIFGLCGGNFRGTSTSFAQAFGYHKRGFIRCMRSSSFIPDELDMKNCWYLVDGGGGVLTCIHIDLFHSTDNSILE